MQLQDQRNAPQVDESGITLGQVLDLVAIAGEL